MHGVQCSALCMQWVVGMNRTSSLKCEASLSVSTTQHYRSTRTHTLSHTHTAWEYHVQTTVAATSDV